MKYLALASLGLGLLISGCGDKLSSETQKAVEQIQAEVSKTTTKAIEDIKTDAVTRLQKVQSKPETKDTPQEKINKNEDRKTHQ